MTKSKKRTIFSLRLNMEDLTEEHKSYRLKSRLALLYRIFSLSASEMRG